ncbi:hypothetical protein [Oceanibacterium hippocampi]|uniref:hypothetical protein n=1 Tax=Oceanibacterium hippocampi TaxID=745714 RepID=UPI00111C53F7|nr:hypothetical protein [Oceanibacterium hippocampi]
MSLAAFSPAWADGGGDGGGFYQIDPMKQGFERSGREHPEERTWRYRHRDGDTYRNETLKEAENYRALNEAAFLLMFDETVPVGGIGRDNPHAVTFLNAVANPDYFASSPRDDRGREIRPTSRSFEWAFSRFQAHWQPIWAARDREAAADRAAANVAKAAEATAASVARNAAAAAEEVYSPTDGGGTKSAWTLRFRQFDGARGLDAFSSWTTKWDLGLGATYAEPPLGNGYAAGAAGEPAKDRPASSAGATTAAQGGSTAGSRNQADRDLGSGNTRFTLSLNFGLFGGGEKGEGGDRDDGAAQDADGPYGDWAGYYDDDYDDYCCDCCDDFDDEFYGPPPGAVIIPLRGPGQRFLILRRPIIDPFRRIDGNVPFRRYDIPVSEAPSTDRPGSLASDQASGDVVRYDSPTIAGFKLSQSWGTAGNGGGQTVAETDDPAPAFRGYALEPRFAGLQLGVTYSGTDNGIKPPGPNETIRYSLGWQGFDLGIRYARDEPSGAASGGSTGLTGNKADGLDFRPTFRLTDKIRITGATLRGYFAVEAPHELEEDDLDLATIRSTFRF